MREIKIGAPGFILADELRKDFSGTIKKVSQLGFDGIELTGFFGYSAEEIRETCERNGIEAFGCFALTPHILCEKMPDNMTNWDLLKEIMKIPGNTSDEKMIYIKNIGCKYIGLCMSKSIPEKEDFEKINLVASYARKYGLTLQYHNHDWEYKYKVEGKLGIDYILENMPNDVLFEPDLGWMAIGGFQPLKALEKYKNQIEIVHLKDYYRDGYDKLDADVDYSFRPTGYGVMDWASLIKYSEEYIKPKWYVTDHDSAHGENIYVELGMSVEYTKNILNTFKN